MTMTNFWKLPILGFAVVAAATLVAACDPYLAANEAPPAVIGAIVVPGSATANRNYNGVVRQPESAGLACPGGLPYPDASGSWFAATYPGGRGNCGSGVTDLVACPQFCWPPRAGPAFAPYYLGDNGASYGCADPLDPRCPGGKYSYATSASYAVNNVPPGVIPTAVLGASYKYNQFRITFNKPMLGSSIQTLPPGTTTTTNGCVAAPGIAMTSGPAGGAQTPVDLALWNVCYVPSSSNENWGASMTVQPRFTAGTNSPALPASTTWVVSGTVKDWQGNDLAVNVSFTTAAAFPEVVP